MNYHRRPYYRDVVYPLTVVLDLDETLVHTISPDALTPQLSTSFQTFPIGSDYVALKRPYLDEFIKEVFEISFPVIVWTAAERNYAEEVCRNIFKNRPPAKIYARENCERKKDHLKKPVQNILTDFGNFVDSDRMVALDDRVSAYYKADREFLVPIQAWIGDPSDDCLLKAISFFKMLKSKDDIPAEIAQISWKEFWL